MYPTRPKYEPYSQRSVALQEIDLWLLVAGARRGLYIEHSAVSVDVLAL
jgi:hypothetical protein